MGRITHAFMQEGSGGVVGWGTDQIEILAEGAVRPAAALLIPRGEKITSNEPGVNKPRGAEA
jgi:hypothetical protein